MAPKQPVKKKVYYCLGLDCTNVVKNGDKYHRFCTKCAKRNDETRRKCNLSVAHHHTSFPDNGDNFNAFD